MSKINLITAERCQYDTGFEVSPIVYDNYSVVYVQANFEDAENDFKQEVDLVYKVEYVKEVIERIDYWKKKRKPYNKSTIYSDIRFHLVYQQLDFKELGAALSYYICSCQEFKQAFKKNPLGGFKMVMQLDMHHQDRTEIEIVEPEFLDEIDIQNIQKTEIFDNCFNITLKSKLKFLSEYQIDVLKKLISLEISGIGIILYPTSFLDELNIPLEERKRFMEAFWRIKDCELIQMSRNAIGEDVHKYELVDNGFWWILGNSFIKND